MFPRQKITVVSPSHSLENLLPTPRTSNADFTPTHTVVRFHLQVYVSVQNLYCYGMLQMYVKT